MRPIIVMPLYDPQGVMFPHLQAITPQLKELFEAGFVSIRPTTRRLQAHYIEWLAADRFFHIYEHSEDVVTVGEDFLPLYAHAAASCLPSHILHLCFVDRVAYALQSEHREQFRADIQMLQADKTPLIFQRTSTAWQTHPQNYRELEQMVTRVGELLFGKSLDFAWCHFAVQAGQLQAVLPNIQALDFSLEAEMILLLNESINTKDVDWLAWEDPFIENCDPQLLRETREASVSETCKRLSYVAPMLQLLRQTACK